MSVVSSSKKLKILVRTPNFLGDHLLAFPFYDLLRKSYLDAHIIFLMPPNLETLDVSHFADEVIVRTLKKLTLKERISLMGFLRQKQLDIAISLPSSLSSAVLLFLSNAKKRFGYTERAGNFFYTRSFLWPAEKARLHKSQLFLKLGELISLSVDLNLPFNFFKKNKVEQKFNRLVVAPLASIGLREWPYFEILVEKLVKAFPSLEIVIVGHEPRSSWKSFATVKNLLGKTSLAELKELIENSDLVLANDSGTAHFASNLLGIKTLVLFGPGNQNYIRPLGPFEGLQKKLSCVPCEKPYCQSPHGYQACLKLLTVEEVFEALSDNFLGKR